MTTTTRRARSGDVDARCVFCDVISGTAAAHVVWRDDATVCFLDKSPLFAGHMLVVPVRHVVTLADLPSEELAPFFGAVQLMSAALPDALGADGTFVANNNTVSQSVAHLHVHVVPRRRGDGLRGFFWPRQRYAAGEAEEVVRRVVESIDRRSLARRSNGDGSDRPTG